MNKLSTVAIISLLCLSCSANVIIKRQIKIERTDGGILIKLAHQKNRVERKGRVVIAVVDTGFDEKYEKQVKLCKTGHKSFVGDNSIQDNHGHGTHITGLIAKNSKVDYCLVIIKYYDPRYKGNNLVNTIKAFEHAIAQDVDMINYSGGGLEPSSYERKVIEKALEKNIMVVAAAGNEGKSFKQQTYYPAMYDSRIIVVGNLTRNKDGKVVRSPSSNYGKEVDIQVFGTRVKSLNGRMTGTSQSTAIVAGRLAEHAKAYRLTEMIRKYNNQGTDNYYSPLYKYMGQ